MKISFEAIGQTVVTFAAADNAADGKVCKVTETQTIGVCDAGEDFCGVISHVENGAAAVIIGGYVELPYSGGTVPAVGYCKLAADKELLPAVTIGGVSYPVSWTVTALAHLVCWIVVMRRMKANYESKENLT